MMENMIRYINQFINEHDPIATKLKKRFPFRRLSAHCFRSYKWAQRINKIEKGDVQIVEISSLFHDIGKCVDNTVEGHAIKGAEICRAYLESIGFDGNKTHAIVEIIRNHIHTRRPDNLSLEAKIERDADILDEIGALTILWDSMGAGADRGAIILNYIQKN